MSLNDVVAQRVVSDAEALRSAYGIKPISNLTSTQKTKLLVEELEANKLQIGQLAAVSPEVRARTVRYKERHMPLADAVEEHTTAVRRRLVASAQRNFGSMPAEALPWIGVSVILAATAWEVYDLCEALKDNYELSVAFNPDFQLPGDVDQVCATQIPTRDELFEELATAPGNIWKGAAETYSDLTFSIPTFSDLKSYLGVFDTAVDKIEEESSENSWGKLRRKFDFNDDSIVEN